MFQWIRSLINPPPSPPVIWLGPALDRLNPPVTRFTPDLPQAEIGRL